MSTASGGDSPGQRHPLEARWAVTRQHLDEACTLLRALRLDAEAERGFAEYREMLEHNELELALDELEHVAGTFPAPPAVWEKLATAAESMKLADRAESCRRRPLREFATRYTAAWCSQNASRVAAFFAPDGSLAINGGAPAVGRSALTEVAQGFMTAFPDMVVTMDDLLFEGEKVVYKWTLAGTNTGPGGTGHRVRISGFEEWRIDDDGLIAESLGHFDSDDYQRQLEHGIDGNR
jgi:predicted ester cyclase